MKLTHLDEHNNPGVVDVSGKGVTLRTAHARTRMTLPQQLLAELEQGDIRVKKGPVFQTAILAGTMAAKKTSDLIPLCHPLPLEGCRIIITTELPDQVIIDAHVKVHHKTGVEMEALTAASVAALTIYDMCKAISHDMVIGDTRLMAKQGGKNDFRNEEEIRCPF